MVYRLEIRLQEKPVTQKNICGVLKFHQIQYCKYALLVQYYKNKYFSLLLSPILIKSLPEGTKVVHSIIDPSIKEGGYSDAWKYVKHHCANGGSQIQGIDFDQYYSPVVHADSFKINISTAALHRLFASILDVGNEFHGKNVPIYERF